MNVEQEGLDDLQGMVNAVDAELTPESFDPGAPAGEMVPAGPDYGSEAMACVDIFAGMLCGVSPACESIWTPAAKERTAGALGPVLEKYGVTMGNIPPELVLVVVAGPLLWQSAKVVGAQVEEAKRSKQQAARSESNVEANPAPEVGIPEGPAVHAQMALYGG